MKFKREDSAQKLKDLVAYKKEYPNLKVMIFCGGWGGCAGFFNMVTDPELRRGFVKSTICILRSLDLLKKKSQKKYELKLIL